MYFGARYSLDSKINHSVSIIRVNKNIYFFSLSSDAFGSEPTYDNLTEDSVERKTIELLTNLYTNFAKYGSVAEHSLHLPPAQKSNFVFSLPKSIAIRFRAKSHTISNQTIPIIITTLT